MTMLLYKLFAFVKESIKYLCSRHVKIINLYNLPTSGVSMLLTAPSEPAVIEELVEDMVVLEPYHLRAPTILT